MSAEFKFGLYITGVVLFGVGMCVFLFFCGDETRYAAKTYQAEGMLVKAVCVDARSEPKLQMTVNGAKSGGIGIGADGSVGLVISPGLQMSLSNKPAEYQTMVQVGAFLLQSDAEEVYKAVKGLRGGSSVSVTVKETYASLYQYDYERKMRVLASRKLEKREVVAVAPVKIDSKINPERE